MYKKISLFLLVSATMSSAFAATAVAVPCNASACQQSANCNNMDYYAANGCAYCAGVISGRGVLALNTCTSNYNLAVAQSQAAAAQQQAVACQVSPPGTPGCG